jgi:ribose-phosphate pyrophosphokinase
MIKVNDHEIKFEYYPNGEVIVPKLLDKRVFTTVKFHWESDDEFVKLALVRGMLRQLEVYPGLIIEYMPYSRMDREQDDHCFSLLYVTNLINAMNWSGITVVEPHSPVTLDLLTRSVPLWATAKLVPTAMKMMAFDKYLDWLVLPAAGV